MRSEHLHRAPARVHGVRKALMGHMGHSQGGHGAQWAFAKLAVGTWGIRKADMEV